MELKAVINKSARWQLDREFAKLNKRAVKLGVAPITVVYSNERLQECKFYTSPEARANGIHSHTFLAEVCDVEIRGEGPKLAGWMFQAKIERLEGAADNMVTRLPGTDELPPKYRTIDPTRCDHCNTHRQRKASFIMKHESGEYKQVGNMCLRDFLGYHNPESLMKGWMTMLDVVVGLLGDAEPREVSGYGGGGVRDHGEPALDLLAMTVAVIDRDHGFKFAPKFGPGTSTAQEVHLQFNPPFSAAARREIGFEQLTPTDDQKARAVAIRDWLAAQPADSDFTRNVQTLLQVERVPGRFQKLVISSVWGYLKAHDAAELANKRLPVCDEFVGKVGERLRNLRLTVERTRIFTGDFGESQHVILRDAAGHVFSWWNRGDRVDDKMVLTLTGTVKQHEVYRPKDRETGEVDMSKPGTKQTVLLRVVWEEVKEEVAA